MNRASQGSFSFPSRIIPRDTFISGTPASVFHEGPAHSVYRNHAPGKLPVNEPSLSFPRKRENLICPTHENIQTASPFSPAACDSAGCHAKTMLPETDMCQCILMDSFMRTNGSSSCLPIRQKTAPSLSKIRKNQKRPCGLQP